MKIVILDGHTLNPGDLEWSPLEEFGDFQVFERTNPSDVVDRTKDAEIVFTNKTVLTESILNKLPKLKYIGVLATGYDVVDIETATKQNIVVTNVPAYGANSVAQMCFAHILNITNRVADHNRDVKKGGWDSQEDFCYWISPQTELSNKIMGIIGYGQIGKATARLAKAFGMKVLINTRTVPSTLPKGVHSTDLNTLLSSSDIISLHCPLTDNTKKLINKENLKRMKEGAILINASRGPLIDEIALADALNSGKIGAAGLDVLSVEPAESSNPLLTAKNCFITPHIAWATREARARLLEIAVENLRAFLQGEPRNLIT